jgi:hypothetical protein
MIYYYFDFIVDFPISDNFGFAGFAVLVFCAVKSGIAVFMSYETKTKIRLSY